MRFKNPQTVRGLVGGGTALADLFLQIRVGGDLALFQAIGALLLRVGRGRHGVRRPAHRRASRTYAAPGAALDWAAVDAATGLARDEIEATARLFADSHGDDRLLGDGPDPAPRLGRHDPRDRQRPAAARQDRPARRRPVPGARALQRAGRPDDGHLRRAAGVGAGAGRAARRRVPAAARATTRSTRSARCATAGRGCSWRSAATSPRPRRTPPSPRRRCAACRLTVHVSTKLNRSHAVPGEDVADPAVPRPHRTRPAGRRRAVRHRRGLDVHGARLARAAGAGVAAPAAPRWRSCRRLGAARCSATRCPGRSSRPTTATVRERDRRGGAGLRGLRGAGGTPRRVHAAAPARATRGLPDRRRAGRTSRSASSSPIEVPPGRLLLQTVRSHDQYNTTIYGLDDRYRGIHGGRRVVFVNPDDLAALGLADGDHRRPRVGVGRRRRAAGARLPGRGLPDRARLRGRVLPGGQRAGAARLDRRGLEHADLEADHRPPGTA